MDRLLDAIASAPVISSLIGVVAGGIATFLTAWFTKLSDWITIQSNRVQGHPVTAALATIGQRTIQQFNNDKVITEAEVSATIAEALQKLGLKL